MDVDGISIVKAQEIADASIVSGYVNPTGYLVLVNGAETEINAGLVKPPPVTIVANQAARDALSLYDGLLVYREDLDLFQGRANGAWVNLMSDRATAWVSIGAGGGAPAYQNSWVASTIAGNTVSARYRLNSAGDLQIMGAMQGGATVTTAFTLPAGFRPPVNTYIQTPIGNNVDQTCVVKIDAATGNVAPQFTNPGSTILFDKTVPMA